MSPDDDRYPWGQSDHEHIEWLWFWAVTEMQIHTLNATERRSIVPMVRAYLAGIDEGSRAHSRNSRVFQVVVSTGVIIGPVVAVIVGHFLK